MKHGKNPTVRQKKFLQERKLNTDNWLICKDTPKEMVIEHRHTGTLRTVYK